MPAIGGPMVSITLNGRNFAVVGDNDTARVLGGSENEVLPNGNGTARKIKTPVPWALKSVGVEIDDDRNDQEFLQDLADGNSFFPISATFQNGGTWKGTGTITGEIAYSSAKTSADINLSGGGKLTPQ